MVRNMYCVGVFAVLALSLAAFGQTSGHKSVGATSHPVGKHQVNLHHYHLAKGNLKSAQHLNGNFLIGAAKGQKGNKSTRFTLHADKGRFAVSANGSPKGIRNTRVSTVVGQQNHNGRIHPNAGLRRHVSMDDTPFVSLQDGDEDENSLTQLGNGQVTITLMFQIGTLQNGLPIFAQVSFQMNLADFLALLGLNNNGPNQDDPTPDPNSQFDPNMGQ